MNKSDIEIQLKKLNTTDENRLKSLANLCRNNNEQFKTMISVRLLSELHDKSLQTDFAKIEEVKEFNQYSRDAFKVWFPYWTDERVNMEIRYLRNYSSLYFDKIVWELNIISQLYKS